MDRDDAHTRTSRERPSGHCPPSSCRLGIDESWEILDLTDGSFVFASIYGDHFRVSPTSPQVGELFARLDGSRTLPQILDSFSRPLSERERESVERTVARLVAAGIVIASARRGPGRDHALAERFRLELDFFAKFADEHTSARDYFERLRNSHVAIIGVGGGGSHCAMYLAAAGIGRLTLIDGDHVERSNLVRQIYYRSADAPGALKVSALADTIAAFTEHTRVDTVPRYVEDRDHCERLLREVAPDFVLPCADSPRVLLHRWIAAACVALELPYMPALNGLLGPIYIPGQTACFGCVEEMFRRRAGGHWEMMVEAMQRRPGRQPPSFVTGPVVSATVQVTDCIGYLTGAWTPESLDHIVNTGRFGVTGREPLPRDHACPICRSNTDRTHANTRVRAGAAE